MEELSLHSNKKTYLAPPTKIKKKQSLANQIYHNNSLYLLGWKPSWSASVNVFLTTFFELAAISLKA